MILFESIEDIKNIPETAVALGNFDGVHYGHQELIKRAVETAKERGLKSAVFTFSNHPKNLLPHTRRVKNIMFQGEKAKIMETMGVDYLFNVPFTKDIMVMSPEEFVNKLLLEKCNMKAAFCGFDYHFAYKASGDADVLRNMGQINDFTVTQIPAFKIKGDTVSSTLIRTLIASGQVEKCKMYMGRNYAIGGEVVVGNKLGRKLGFPTSNLVIDESMVTPPNGVYVTYCDYNGVRYPSVTNVGVKPTIGNYKKNVETHIFNFDKELYGKHITVEFLQKMRDEVKFDDVKALSEQIIRDCRDAKEYHTKLGENIEK